MNYFMTLLHSEPKIEMKPEMSQEYKILEMEYSHILLIVLHGKQ